jgi:hypothetical protein
MYIRLGAQQTEPENGQSDTNVIGGLGGRWTSPRNALFLDLTRSVGPIAAGTVVERHQLRVLLDHDVSPRLSLLLGARASRDEEIEGFATRRPASTRSPKPASSFASCVRSPSLARTTIAGRSTRTSPRIAARMVS